MAAPSSLHTIPSQITITSATIQPSIACGPPSAVMSSGIVMNGPAPIMFVMLSAVAGNRPKRRGRGGGDDAGSGAVIGRTSHPGNGGASRLGWWRVLDALADAPH